MAVAGDRPNIIFFFTDQQRWDTCGCYGQRLPVTGNFDRLAAEGVRFEYACTRVPMVLAGPPGRVLPAGRSSTNWSA